VSISDDIEATLAQLGNLHAADQARKAADFAKLQSIVLNLDTVIPPLVDDYEPIEPLFRRREEPRQAPPDIGDGFGEQGLPHGREGHELGPAVRRKLIAEIQDKGNW
jgi:hypothetical protein